MNRLVRAICVFLVAVSSGCGGGGGGGGGSGGGIGGTGAPLGTGTVRFALTDAPACGYDHVHVTIDRVRVSQGADAGDGDPGWSEVVLPVPLRIDLLSLTNGALAELGQAMVPTGTYRRIRLVLVENGSAQPFANSVVPSGGAETPLSTPSAQQSGLKIDADFVVADASLTDLVIDFDACKSVVKAGNSGRYNLKPVLRVLPRGAATGNRVTGYVRPDLLAASPRVSLQAGGIVIKSTAPDVNGQFVLSPVPDGSYDLVITAPGRVTTVTTDLPVSASTSTAVNTLATALALPPPSSQRVVSGTVNRADASVRALQALATGRTVEVASAPVDALSGAFTFLLPIGGPVVASYSSVVQGLPPIADSVSTSRYVIDAYVGLAHTSQPVKVDAIVPPVLLSLPTSNQ